MCIVCIVSVVSVVSVVGIVGIVIMNKKKSWVFADGRFRSYDLSVMIR